VRAKTNSPTNVTAQNVICPALPEQ